MVNSAKIKARLSELGLSQKVVSQKMNLSQGVFSQKTNNIRSFSLEEAEKLSEILEISDSEFGFYFFESRFAQC